MSLIESKAGRSRLDQLARIAWDGLVIAVAAWMVMVIVARLRLVLLPLTAALMIASVLYRPHRYLVGRGWPTLAATWALFAAGGLVLVVTGWFSIPPLSSGASALGNSVLAGITRLQSWLSTTHFGLPAEQAQTYLADLGRQLVSGAGPLVTGLLGGATRAGEFIVGALLTAVLAFFLLQDGDRMLDGAARLARSNSGSVREVAERVRATLAAYLEAAAFNGAINALLTALLLLLLGMPLVLPVAAITFFAGFVPVLGALVVGVLVGLVGFATGGIGTAALAVGGVVIIHHVEGYLVSPLIFRRRLRLSGFAIVLGLTAGTVVAGVAGAVIALPAMAVVSELFAWFRERASIARDVGGSGLEAPDGGITAR